MATFAELASRVDATLIADILAAKESEKTATWGYAADGKAEIFRLAPGERLPEGWVDSPAKVAAPRPAPVAPAAAPAAPARK